MSRAPDIDDSDSPGLDARAIVQGHCVESATRSYAVVQTPGVVWEGNVAGDGTGPQRSYYVRLYDDGTGHCQCPAFYFRGVLRRDPTFACKHVRRARAAAQGQP